MLLQRFTNSRIPAVLLALLVVAGCASGSPAKAPESRRDQPHRAGDAVEGEQAELAIPPQVQTLYEQAASAMAAGDYVDAAPTAHGGPTSDQLSEGAGR